MSYFENEGEDFEGSETRIHVVSTPNRCQEEQEKVVEAPPLECWTNKDEEIAGEDESRIAAEICGCPCKPHNRFLLSFHDTSYLDDTCLNESKFKCKAFWEYIDSNQRLSQLIKEGHFPPVPLQNSPYNACAQIRPSQDATLRNACESVSQDVRAAEALAIEVKLRSEAQRRVFQNRRNFIAELQLKSGQAIFHAKKEPIPSYFRNVFADEVQEIQTLECLT